MLNAAMFGPESFEFKPRLEVLVAVGICLVISVFAIIIGIIAKKHDYKKAPKGMLLLIDWAVENIDKFVEENMGKGFENFGGIILGLAGFLLGNFLIGLIGLPTPMAYLPVPLCLSLLTFIMIHFTSMRFTKLRYFKRYIEPIPVFLPVNLLSMWAPILSISLRLFGNALAGTIILTLVNFGLKNLGDAMFAFISEPGRYFLLPSVMTPLLHAYFDVVGALIQCLVYVYITCLLVAQEKPDDYDEKLALATRKENK